MRFLILFLLIFNLPLPAQELPAVNKAIVAFCEKNKEKKVGKGECWDLAKEALDEAGAKWTSPSGFGKALKKKEVVLPGDIIQFENVKIVYPDKSSSSLPHHTAIVIQVLSPGRYIIAEQNANGKRLVTFSEIDLNYVKKGKYIIFRPQQA